MNRFSLIVLVLSFAITTPTKAEDKDGRYYVEGPITCGKWVEFRKEDSWEATTYRAWIAGYITAYNKQTPNVFHIMGSTDLESVELWMEKYCQENPLKDLSNGMRALTDELWPNRKRTADD